MGKLLSIEMEGKAFSRTLEKFLRKQSPAAREATARKLLFRLLAMIIEKAPVKTGRSRAGWSAGAEAAGMPAPPPGDDEKATEEGRSLSAYTETRSQYGIKLTVANRVWYVEGLEFGNSAQAPFGMVRISVREMEQAMGGRQIPEGIFEIYKEAWAALGLPLGTPLGRGLLKEALGLTHGAQGMVEP